MSTTSTNGWFRVQDAVVARIVEIGPLALAVYVALAKHAGKDGRAWPSIPTIAALTGSTPRGVRKAMHRLVSAGLIEMAPRSDPSGRRTSNVYRLLTLHPPLIPGTESTGHRNGEHGGPGTKSTGDPEPGAGDDPERRAPGTIPIGTRPKEPDPREGTAATTPDRPLGEILAWWNGLHARKLVNTGVNVDHPNDAIQGAWKRVQKSKELRAMFSDLSPIERSIEASDFVREGGWFTLAKLMGGRNKDRELIIEKLLNGGYKNGNGKHARVGAGQRYDPGTADTEFTF